MYAQAQGPMLQLLCNTSGKADSLNANISVITGFFSYACLKDSIIVGKIERYKVEWHRTKKGA